MISYKKLVQIGPGRLFFIVVGVITFITFTFEVVSETLNGEYIFALHKYGIKFTGIRALIMQSALAVAGFILVAYSLSGIGKRNND